MFLNGKPIVYARKSLTCLPLATTRPLPYVSPITWVESLAAQAGFTSIVEERSAIEKSGDRSLYMQCKSAVLPDGDDIRINCFVLLRTEFSPKPTLGRVQEILRHGRLGVVQILVNVWEISEGMVLPYRMPSLCRLDKQLLIQMNIFCVTLGDR